MIRVAVTVFWGNSGNMIQPTCEIGPLSLCQASVDGVTGSSSFVEVEDEGECSSLGGSGGNLATAAAASSAVPSLDSGGRASVLGSFLHRLNRPAM